jgi:hypothetical protein
MVGFDRLRKLQYFSSIFFFSKLFRKAPSKGAKEKAFLAFSFFLLWLSMV